MFFSIDPQSAVPIYEQIVRQVKFAIADGTLVGGQMLPSVRQLSRDIALNPNTIARAYRELQAQQILKPLRGRGLVVRRDAVDLCLEARNEIVAANVRATLSDAFSGGMSAGQLREIFEQTLHELQLAEEASASSSLSSGGEHGNDRDQQ
ncbi:GntR family transcriptional regulator [Rhodopirellula sallentina]|uniref:Transcriptional regulator, GntR family n=1 Tax=Rhodopirellula sallentina SM41 TaxID=1263870 RepID=M5U970_9BACT|nr:GntR family transcriptional regulator [Rhodopirellula sallentina]EMI58007.1 transcriptional regulator, GntR family [Rhodopirellula sallentina SM41]